jgi:alkaline phosphatase
MRSSSTGSTRLAALMLVIAGCASSVSSDDVKATPFSAVLLIGDGMGPNYVTAARLNHPVGALALDRLPHTALIKTASASHLVTDSAAAATAIACGQLTTNGVLCQGPTGADQSPGQRLESLAEWARARGILVGIVTNTTVTDATPAAWYAHTPTWHEEAANAIQLRASSLNFVLGGGARYVPAEVDWSPWQVIRDPAALPDGPATPEMRVLGVFADGHLPYENPVNPSQLKLRTLVDWALRAMTSSGRPFLLVIEGGLIDHAGHENLARTAVNETQAFDAVVEHVVRTVDPASTLVLATADHEVGGLTLNGYPEQGDSIFMSYPYGPVLTFSIGPGLSTSTANSPFEDDPRPSHIPLDSGEHTGGDVILYGWGMGAGAVAGTLDHTAVYRLLREHLRHNPDSQ